MTERGGMAANENERRIDETIARIAARSHHVDAFEAAVAEAESKLHIEMRTPATGANRPVDLTRRAIERAVRGYVGWISAQVAAFDRSIFSAVRELGDRVRAVEARTDVVGSAVTRLERSVVPPDGFDGFDGELATAREEAMSQPWADRALDALGHPGGRVLHAEAGTGTMVAALQAKGFDAYGVEPSYGTYEVGVEEGLEIHYGDVVDHLLRVPRGALSRIILSGCVERLGVPDLVTLSRCAGALLERGGRIVVCSATPESWSRTEHPAVADLAPGRPLHSATWVELLAREHFDGIIVLDDAPEWYVVSAERSDRG
jgi:Methionine biosynthesis protein MetW